MRNIAELFFKTVKERGTDGAITCKDLSLTWSELYERVEALRIYLKEQGVKRGEVVAIYCDHDISQVVALLAIASCDGIFTILNKALVENQIIYQLSDADVGILIGSHSYLKKIEQIIGERGIIKVEITSNGSVVGECPNKVKQKLSQFPKTRNIPADVANIVYTSGSTGSAKGVVISHRVLLDGARIVSTYLNIKYKEVILSVLPFSFDYGLNQLMTCIYNGSRIVLHNLVFPKEMISVLLKEEVTGLAGVPSMWANFFNEKLINQNICKSIKTLRYITTAGGPHSQELLKRLKNYFPPTTEIFIMYGLTESFRSTYLPSSELLNRIGSIGKPVPEVEILIKNEKGEECKVGEKGELIHRGAFITYGYINNKQETQKKFIRLETVGEGAINEIAVKSGDLVSRDKQGFIYYHGRIDNQIKADGYRISPTEIEEAALSYPCVHMAAAVGLHKSTEGTIICLAYVNNSGDKIDDKKLKKYLMKNLPYYAVPVNYVQLKRMPVNPNHKINYNEIIKIIEIG